MSRKQDDTFSFEPLDLTWAPSRTDNQKPTTYEFHGLSFQAFSGSHSSNRIDAAHASACPPHAAYLTPPPSLGISGESHAVISPQGRPSHTPSSHMLNFDPQLSSYPELRDLHNRYDLSNTFSEPPCFPSDNDDSPQNNTLPYHQSISSSAMPETENRWIEQFPNQSWQPYANTTTETISDPVTTVAYSEGEID